MAFFKQLRLLLKHKILLRRRQPTTLFLELFWPAIVFLAILIVRWQFPATFRQTCYYNAKALPSAGIVNLMQSYVCNVDNTCLNASQYQEVPNYPNASIHDIVDQLMPLLTNKNVTNVINDLPKGIRLIASIIDTLSITPVQNLLEDGFPLRNALRPAGWTKVEHELNRLESTVVPFSDFDLVAKTDSIESHNNNNNHSTLSSYEMLVNSSLNLIQLGMQSDSSGFRSIRSFRDVICDHTQLEKFLIVPQRHYVRLLSRRLCLLERKDLYHLFDLVQENIDFGRILEKLSTILKSVGLVDHQQNVDNIIAMISTIERANIFRSVSALRNTSWMYDMPNLFNVLRSGDIDVGTLLKIVDDIEPILYDDEDDDEDNNGDENEQIDSSMEDPINPLDDQRQQQQLDFIMQFYNADDSTLKNVANWPFESDDNSTMLINDDEDDLELPNLSDTTLDLDVSESKSSNVASATTSRRANSNIQNESLSRKFLPKLLANMDRLIDNVEAFTQTPQWDSLLSTFEGLQMLLEISDDDGAGADSATILSAKNKLSSMKIEKIVLTLPKKFQTFSNFFNSLIPEKFQPLIYPLFNLLHRASDSTLQHLGGAFSRALAEDKIFYFDKFAQLLIYSIHNGTFPRKCIDIQQAMCDLEQFKNVFVFNVDEDTGESSILYDEDPGTLQGIQELGCLFLGQNYWQENEEESTPILAKLYYTLSTLNETNLLSSLTSSSNLSSPLSSSSNSSSNTSSTSSDDAFWTNFTSRMLEVYLLATKSVPANTWNTIWNELRSVWKSNDTPDRIIYLSRITQLSADCFIPNGIVQSTIWRAIYRKKAIAHELFNVVLNEINTSAESETLKVSQIAMGSPTLEQFFQNNLKIFPTLIDAMAETFFFHLPQFVDKLFQSSSYMITGWPCNRHSLADISFALKHKCDMGDRFRIVDELTDPSNNESRIAPLIRAMQSKSLNLTEIHQNLPPLDWVEAATSVSLIKESVEKIISMDNSLVWFPDVPQLDNSIRSAIDRSHQAYRRFSTQGTVGMIAYIGDIVTPFIDRYLILNETFSTSCDMGLAGLLMAPVYHDKEWRCLFISLKYASYSINHLFELINEVLANLLSGHHSCTLSENGNTNSSNVNRLISLSENMPEVVEILLNELLVGNRNRISHTGSIRDLLCGSNQNLDIFGRRGVLYNEIRQNICNLTNDLVTCTHLTMPEQWQQAFEHLNDTWYIQSPDNLSSKASFADAYRNIYQFFTLFGQFSPSTVNHLIETFRSTDGQQYVANILKRMNRFDHLRGKRFVYIMQTMSDELFTLLFGNRLPQNQRLTEERRDLLMALIYAFNELPARLRQRYKLGGIYVKIPPMAINPDVDDDDMLLHADLLDSLLDWIDAHLLVASETFLQTITLDMQRLLKLFQNRYDMVTVWRSFCRSPLSQYVVVDNQISVGAHKAKDEICQLDFNAVFDQWYRSSQSLLSNHTDRELIDLFLFKAGSFLDIVLKDSTYKRDLLKSDDWFPILSKLKRLVLGSETTDSSNGWLIDSMSQFLHVLYPKPTLELIHRGMKRFECGLDTITPNGLNWELVPNIYRNKTQVLSLFSSINSAFTLGTIGLNTFLVQVKFYKYLQMITKYGGRGFCYLKSEQDFEDIFAVSNAIGHSTDDAIMVLRNLQSLLCNSNHDLLFQLNPVSQCFRMKISSSQPNSIGSDLQALQNKFVNTFSKVHNEVEADDQETSLIPPILDLDQWNRFFQWWSKEVTPYPNSGRTLLSMRMFQLVDVLADNHVIWKAFYRLTFIVSEMFAYSLRALQLSEAMYPMKPNLQISTDNIPLKMIKHSVDSSTNRKGMSSLLTSTVSNLIFPEVNHFITFATFRQLRWIKHISHFFAKHPNILHDELCPTLNSIHNQKMSNSSASSPITVDDDFNDLLLLLCHNHPSDWIYTLTFKSNLFNVKTSPRPKLISHRRIRERIGKLTQVLARMLDYNSEKNNNQKLDQVVRFIKLKQLESIENVAGTATLLTDAIMLSQKNGKSTNYVKSSFRELINTGWRSVPALLDAVDQYICNYKRSDNGSSANDDDGLPPFLYRPKAPDMKIVMCEMPQWDFDRAYSYLSKHLDLRHMLQMFVAASGTGSNGTTTARCVTPLRFISRWVDMSQDIFEQLSTSSFWSELKSCRRRHLLTILAASKSSSNNFLFKHSLRYVRFMNGLFSTVDKFSHDSNGLSWDNIRELWRTFSYFVLNQVPAYVPITDIVRHDVNLPEFLNATLDRVSTLSRSRAKQAIRLLTDSALDINLISWHNFSNIALKEMICRQQENSQVSARQTLSKQYLPLILANSAQRRNVSLDTSQLNLYETLCQSGNLIQIIDSLMSVIDQKSIYSKLSDLQRNELAKSEWDCQCFYARDVTISTEMISSGTLLELGDKISLLQNAAKNGEFKPERNQPFTYIICLIDSCQEL
ncbi:hypothetical protein BLOT_011444 [Blomia tropicalis]|nr:hypothetical protein BLOT_011444 [Blomia tropicalis]